MKYKILLLFIMTVCGLTAVAGDNKSFSVNFATGKWDKSLWTQLRLPHQAKIPQFIQRDNSLGTDTFTKKQKQAKLDNVIMTIDSRLTEGEFEVTFMLDAEPGTAPGFLLAPVIKDGVLQQAICIFVASYTMAVWVGKLNPITGKFEYKHLARLNRWSAPGKKHIFRCRYNKKSNSFIVQIDNSDPLMFRNVGCKINSQIGIWGCHGKCDYYKLKINPHGTLPWSACKPKGIVK
jgi:hypothetical protein